MEKLSYFAIHTFVLLKGKTYRITAHRINIDINGISCETDMLETTDEGDDLDLPTVTYNLDNYDFEVLSL